MQDTQLKYMDPRQNDRPNNGNNIIHKLHTRYVLYMDLYFLIYHIVTFRLSDNYVNEVG